MIAAIGLNRELGKDNTLIWKLTDDLYRFSIITRDKMVVMGRKTLESLPGPLARREMVVLTRSNHIDKFVHSRELNIKVKALNSVQAVMEYAKEKFADEVYIIGGGEIYKEFLPIADELDLTIVEEVQSDADVYFPVFEDKFYCKHSVEMYDERLDIKFKFTRWAKK